ncbi:hypothetical protein [Flavicella marina]|uniref:hypothetical protein n=1 Tax=Flavicella marina TaxID=1475951 RepID=UPI0012654823|nr:hypothetical protein [Flavicella marina]
MKHHSIDENDFSPDEFWKNFRLGTELTISGNFIYNGLHCFELMSHFYYDDESFEFLYNISVGIERLQKITLILLEHNLEIDQEEFEKSLITHNHIDIHNRIEKHINMNLGKVHLEFLNILSRFYKTSRYEKFSLKSVYKSDTSKSELINFINKNLNIKISTDFFSCTENDERIKKFIGKTIGKISTKYYNQIIESCRKLNIYTYEVSTESKAFKIFLSKEFDFINEKIIQREIIKFLLQAEQNDLNRYLENEPSLELEYFRPNTYINYLMDYHKKTNFRGEISELYTEIDNIKKRFNHLELIGHIDIDFNSEK